MLCIAFTGGGTGGHIYPGLAVVSYLQRQMSLRVFWIGSNSGMDRSVVESAGLEFFGIPSGKLRRYFSLRNLADIFKVAAGFLAAWKILKREKPALLFSKGGFVSVPPCAAAAVQGIPVFTHESDFSPGLATRINTRFAEKIFTAYAGTAAFFRTREKEKIRLTGNPIRPEFRSADPRKGRAFLGLEENSRILLVLGGSQGAREINELVWKCLPELTREYVVVHQTGPGNDGDRKRVARYLPFPYIKEELPHIIAAAELVLCRSGAGTIWECAALGKPMIFVPLSGSGTRGDQVENARIFEEAGAGVTLLGGGVTPEKLTETIKAIAGDEKKRKAMAGAAVKIAGADGAALITEILIKRLGVIDA
jgi:UDP-N-acetylglucosamine--N-acetylmuramyl-(pentapeptide) pyrophosphoryl-undecaprenol N-acetylglucosamine transferase